MNKIHLALSGFATATILIAMGCRGGSGEYTPEPQAQAQSAPIEPVDVSRFNAKTTFPFKVGNEWTYELENVATNERGEARREFEVTYRVAKVEGNRAHLEVSVSEDGVIERQIWEANDKGVFQIAVGKETVAFDKPQPAVNLPVEIGRESTWIGHGLNPSGQKSDMTVKSRVVGPEEVDTGIGRMSALAVDGVSDFRAPNGNGRAINKTWWAPGIGIVRFRQEMAVPGAVSSITMRLMRTNVK